MSFFYIEEEYDLNFFCALGNAYEIKKYRGRSKVANIPNLYNGTPGEYPVVKIGNGAFYKKQIEVIIIPDNIQEIGRNAFSCCHHLKELNIGKGLTKIGEKAFYRCTTLESIAIDNDNPVFFSRDDNGNYNIIATKEDGKLLYGCKNSSIPEGIKEISAGAFYECKDLKQIVIPEGVRVIGKEAFNNCQQLIRAYLPGTLENVDRYIFKNCGKLKLVQFNGTAEKWGRLRIWNYGFVVNCTDNVIKP